MSEKLSRQALYDLVWSVPLKELAPRFGISDVGLKKICARTFIPTPERGYWARKAAGKQVIEIPLPPRPPGLDPKVRVAGGRQYWYQDHYSIDHRGPLPDPPEFPDSLDEVRARVQKAIGKVTIPRIVHAWHPAIDRLIKADQARAHRQLTERYPSIFDKPLFQTPFERRRFRILDALFLAVARIHGKPDIRNKEGRDIYISCHQHGTSIALDSPKALGLKPSRAAGGVALRDSELAFSISHWDGQRTVATVWQDDESSKLESKLTEIAIATVMRAEENCRESALRHYEWRVAQKARLEEEDRQRVLQNREFERERQCKLEQARIDRLLRDATSFRQARDIRQYVESVSASIRAQPGIPRDKLFDWKSWALAQADSIDPILEGRFLESMIDAEAKIDEEEDDEQ